MYQRLHGNFITGKQMLAYKSTHLKQLIYVSPVHSNTKSVRTLFKGGLPETVEIQNCSVIFLLQATQLHMLCSSIYHVQHMFICASALMREVTQIKQPSIVRIFPKDGTFVLCLKQTIVYDKHLSAISISNVLIPCMLDAIFVVHVSAHATTE